MLSAPHLAVHLIAFRPVADNPTSHAPIWIFAWPLAIRSRSRFRLIRLAILTNAERFLLYPMVQDDGAIEKGLSLDRSLVSILPPEIHVTGRAGSTTSVFCHPPISTRIPAPHPRPNCCKRLFRPHKNNGYRGNPYLVSDVRPPC